MNKKTIQFNNLEDIYKALEADLITPNQAIEITCKALNMIDLKLEQIPVSKKDVLEQIQKLDIMIDRFGDIPIFFIPFNDF